MNVAPLRTQTGRGLVQCCLHEPLDVGGLIKIEQRIDSRDIDLTNSGNSWRSGGGMNLKAGGTLSLVGAQIKGQGYQARAGGNYEERAAYDVKERVNVQSIKKSGAGVYLRDFNNNMLALATLGDQGGRSETARTETHIDSTRTAIVTNIDAGSGAVGRRVGGDAFIEGSVIRGGQGKVEPLKAGGKVTQVAAMDTRHVEDSVFTSTIRWQSTQSKGSIEQTIPSVVRLIHIPGTIGECFDEVVSALERVKLQDEHYGRDDRFAHPLKQANHHSMAI